jgi:hypothetical protein
VVSHGLWHKWTEVWTHWLWVAPAPKHQPHDSRSGVRVSPSLRETLRGSASGAIGCYPEPDVATGAVGLVPKSSRHPVTPAVGVVTEVGAAS